MDSTSREGSLLLLLAVSAAGSERTGESMVPSFWARALAWASAVGHVGSVEEMTVIGWGRSVFQERFLSLLGRSMISGATAIAYSEPFPPPPSGSPPVTFLSTRPYSTSRVGGCILNKEAKQRK